MQYDENITVEINRPLLLGQDPKHDVRYGSHISKREKMLGLVQGILGELQSSTL